MGQFANLVAAARFGPPLPDFNIGGLAHVQGLALLTRDPSRYRTWFPSVRLIAPPETGAGN